MWKVLIVDDDAVTRRLLIGVLQEYATCDIACDGQEGLEAKYRHLPINHFHNELQKVKGKVNEFTELNEKRFVINALMRMESQEDNSLFFIIGYRLKGWISARIVGCLRKKASPTAITRNTLSKLHLTTDYPQNGGKVHRIYFPDP